MNRFSAFYIMLVVASMGLVTVAYAQTSALKETKWQRTTPASNTLNTGNLRTPWRPNVGTESELTRTLSPRVPVVATSIPKLVEMLQDDGVGTLMGTTYYDFQTNASMSNRVTYFSEGGDKFIQMLWMVNMDSTRDLTTRVPGFNPSRGTHYNFIDVSNPDELEPGITPWKRIESERAGWPSAIQFDDGTLGTPSHTPVRFYRNGGITDDNWERTPIDPTTTEDAVWARAAVDGQNNVHLIYNRAFDQPDPTPDINQVCYRRSLTAGDSWEPEIQLTGPNQPGATGTPPEGNGGDTYAIAARGDRVSVAVYTGFGVVLWHSTNNGATWTRRVGPSFTTNAGTPVDTTFDADTMLVHSDTAMGPLNSLDVIIDNQGVTHFVVAYCPQYIIQRTEPGAQPQNFIYFLNGYHKDQSELQYTGLAYGNSADTQFVYFMGPVGGGSWDGNGQVINNRLYDAGSRWPQLGVDANDNLYCLYGSMKNGDTKSVTYDSTYTWATDEPDTLVTLDGLNMHVYGTQKYAGTNLWSAPKDLSPTGVNSQYASLCDVVADGRLYYAYSSAPSPGDRVSNVTMPAELASIYFRALPITELNVPSDVADDAHALKADVVFAPNPSDDGSRITISGVTNGAILVSLASSVGEIVMQTSTQPFGERAEILISTRGLASGAYLVTIQQNGRRITKTLSVIH